MQAISHQKQIFYILLLGLFPLLFVQVLYFSKNSEQTSIGLELELAINQARHKASKEYLNKAIRQKFQNIDHFYIDKEIETITPLSQETQKIQAILQQGFHHEEDQLNKRLQFLTKGQNNINFIEAAIKPYATFQETMETLASPIEVNLDDLKGILAKIEELPSTELASSKPHLIITECKIERKKGTTQEVFFLDLKALKREYLK